MVSSKDRVNVTLDKAVIKRARDLDINFSSICETALIEEVSKGSQFLENLKKEFSSCDCCKNKFSLSEMNIFTQERTRVTQKGMYYALVRCPQCAKEEEFLDFLKDNEHVRTPAEQLIPAVLKSWIRKKHGVPEEHLKWSN